MNEESGVNAAEDERKRRVEEHRRRGEENPLEAVRWLTNDDKQRFNAEMERKGIEVGSEVWRREAKAFVDRLWDESEEPSGTAPETSGDGGASTSSGVRRRADGVVEGEEGRPVRTAAPIYTPTEKERREHEASGHAPYRSWCECCVDGRAAAEGHFRSKPDEPSDPNIGEIHFDYCFLKSKVKDDPAVTLVGVDKGSDAVLAHVVPQKGSAWEWVASQLDKDIKKWGYRGRVVVKSDGENAARELMEELARKRAEAATVVECSKPYDSKSNGRAENTVKKLESQARTLKLAVERACKIDLDVHSPAFAWLVLHSADVLTKCTVGRDGRTPYERLKGKRYHGLMVPFGSMVHVKIPGKPQGGIMATRWLPGVWLGKKWSSDEHVAALANGKVVRARDVRPFPDGELYDPQFVLGVAGTPQNPSAIAGVDDVIREIPRVPMSRPEGPVTNPVARKAILHKRYFDKAGYSQGCPKCRSMLRGEDSSKSAGHTEACRKRIEEWMRNDSQLRERLDAARLRQDQYLAGEVDKGDVRHTRAASSQPKETVVEPPSQAEGTAVPEEDDDGIPEVNDEDAEVNSEPEVKRARIGSIAEESTTGNQEPRSAEAESVISGDGEPDGKRQRTGSLNVMLDDEEMKRVKKVSWADADELDSSAISCFTLRCDHCDAQFQSRNALFAHLHLVRKEEPKNDP